jgi:hypothetical protein
MDAAARWNSAAVQFRFFIRSPAIAADPCIHTDRVNTAAFVSTICGMAFGNALAVTILLIRPTTGELIDTDVLFDRGRQWSTYPGPLRLTAIDFHRVALHEFGHVLGLAHPDEHGQNVITIMNSRVGNLDNLQSDDIRGVNTIYLAVDPGGLGSNDYCKVAGPCGVGEGDCDNNQECQSGLVCVNNVGAKYGFRSIVDVCEAPVDHTALGGNDYCKVAGPCGVGEGDCDNNQECQSGLVCVNNVGANYGFRPIVDVCEAP